MKIKEVIEELKQDPDEVLTNLDAENLKKILDFLANKYYNYNESLISDQLFDYIKDFYEKNFNNNKKITIGSKIPKTQQNEKVVLPYFLGSLDKIKPSMNAFNKWLDNYSGPYVISYKLDGLSALLHKKDNKVYLYTRGDGNKGRDISNILKHININVENLINDDAIRGELVMSKTNFKTINKIMSNARNAVGGIITKADPKMLKLVDFVPYWVLNPQLKQTEQMKYIEKKKFNTGSVDYKIKDKITTEYLSEMLLEAREKYKYEIDGLVVIDSSKYYPIIPNTNPEFGFAFKQVLTDQIAETTVIDVIWEISKDKYIKPKIKIDTVEIGGAEINYATANNAKFVYVNKLGPGSKIKLIRSGDVIPKIEEILTPSDSGKPKMPSFDYEWNETEVDIIATNLDEDNMSKLIVKKLSYFFSTLDIKFMGEATVQKFVDNGFDDLWKILKADKNLLKKINGLGAKSVDKIYKSIDDGLTNRKLYDIMSASQVFGRGIGSKKFKIILDAYPNIIDIFKTKGKNHVMKLINELSGFDVKTTNKIIDSMDAFIEYYKELVLIKPNIVISDNTENLETKKITSEFSNYLNQFINNSIVFTGFRDTVLQSKLQTLNIKITDSVSKNTKLVIASDVSDNSSKLKKAKELNIPIISKQEFTKLITK